MAGQRPSHVLAARRTRGLQHHPPCAPPLGPVPAGRRTVCGWRRRSQTRASHRKGATPFPWKRDEDADKSRRKLLLFLCCSKVVQLYEREGLFEEEAERAREGSPRTRVDVSDLGLTMDDLTGPMGGT